jgi:hypothetical protein
MKSNSGLNSQDLVDVALARLKSPAGQKELLAAKKQSRQIGETFRRARQLSPEARHRRFTV